MSLLHLFEPEESVGTLWHNLVGGGSSLPRFPEAAALFDDVAPCLRVYFHALGGEAGAELKSTGPEISHHRLSRRLRLGVRRERIARASYDGDSFRLPDQIDAFPDRAFNALLYYWLAAWTAVGGGEAPARCGDPLACDLARLEHARRTTQAVLAAFPGLAGPYRRMSALTLAQRPERSLPPVEAQIERAIRRILAAGCDETNAFADADVPPIWSGRVAAPAGYLTFLPVALWGEIEARPAREGNRDPDEEPGSGQQGTSDGRHRRARRRSTDQINRKGGFFVHRFEKVLTWTEFMNLHRDVVDDDEQSARKAADDHDEIGLGKLDRRAATRLKIDLDLAPSDVDVERLSGEHTYPEWDYRRQVRLPHHVRVLERRGGTGGPPTGWQPGEKMERRIRAVRRQFEALRPKREVVGRQLDGHELDMDALVRSIADTRARGEGSDRIYRQARDQARDLSVAVVIDASRSTESFVENRPVIDIAREALIALAEGLDACGDEAGIFSFSSLRRDRVFVHRLKDFDEPMGSVIRARIAALRPGFYTRLGAAIRHASAALAGRASRKRLLLVLTDGKPNDLDHYEGRFGIEDSRKAIEEARRAGQAVFGITIDSAAKSYVPRIFGAGGFAIVSHPARLTAALPVLYRHLMS